MICYSSSSYWFPAMDRSDRFVYVNNIYSTRGHTPMVSTQSLANLEVLRHLHHVSSKPHNPRPQTAVNNPHRRDHLREMWQGLRYGSDLTSRSTYSLGFAQSQAMKEELQGKNYVHHFKRDEITNYTEAMCRHKLTIRHFEVIKRKK